MLYIKILGNASGGHSFLWDRKDDRSLSEPARGRYLRASDICPDGKWASGIQCIGDHRDHWEGSDKAGGRIGDWLAGLALQFRTEEYASSFEQIWTGSIESLMEYSYLTDVQIGAVKELGKWLCYMDIDMQIRNLKLWEQNMQTEYEEQKDRAHRINKVSRSLGLLGGIFLIILIG